MEVATEWLYHVTRADRLPSIRKAGLIPSTDPRWGGKLGKESIGKIYFGRTLAIVYFAMLDFTPRLDEVGLAYLPVVLRVPISEVSEVTQEKKEPVSVFTTKRVKPDRIEVFWIDKWIPLEKADFINEDMVYRLTEDGVKNWAGDNLGPYADIAESDANYYLPEWEGHLLG